MELRLFHVLSQTVGQQWLNSEPLNLVAGAGFEPTTFGYEKSGIDMYICVLNYVNYCIY